LAGALLREGLSSRRQRPFWAVTLRAVDGPAAGADAELRLWPESNPEWFQGRLSLLCDADPETIAALTLDEQHALLLRTLARRSYAGILETAADGLADVAYLDGPRERAEVPADLPEQPVARHVAPPPAVPAPPPGRPAAGRAAPPLDAPEPPPPPPPFTLVTDAAALTRLCERLAP